MQLAKGLFVLFRPIKAECGLCCDVKWAVCGGGTNGLKQTLQDFRVRIQRSEMYPEEREEHSVPVCLSIIQSDWAD